MFRARNSFETHTSNVSFHLPLSLRTVQPVPAGCQKGWCGRSKALTHLRATEVGWFKSPVLLPFWHDPALIRNALRFRRPEKGRLITPRILRRPQVEASTGLSRSTLYAMMAEGEFPQPVRLGKRAVGWSEAAIAEWLESRKPRNAV